MKTEITKKIVEVDYILEQREQLSEKLSKMSKEEIIDYFKNKKPEKSTESGAK